MNCVRADVNYLVKMLIIMFSGGSVQSGLYRLKHVCETRQNLRLYKAYRGHQGDCEELKQDH